MLYELSAGASLSADDTDKPIPAHLAAEKGHEGCLRVLHELGTGASLSAKDGDKRTLPPPAAACIAQSQLLASYSAVSYLP